MRDVFVHQDFTRVGLCKTVLDAVGIPNFIRNQYTNNSLSELPSPIFFPALCVIEDEDYDEAVRVLRGIPEGSQTHAPNWRCQKCNEIAPGNFDSCWNCGTEREPTA